MCVFTIVSVSFIDLLWLLLSSGFPTLVRVSHCKCVYVVDLLTANVGEWAYLVGVVFMTS